MNKIQALELSAGLSALVTGMEDELLQNIAAYLLGGRIESDVAKWKIRKLAELGKLNQKNIETIKGYIPHEKELAELTLKRAAVDAFARAESGFRKLAIAGLVKDAPEGSMERTMSRVLKTLGKQAKDELNLVNTTMLGKARQMANTAVQRAARLAEDQQFLDALNKAAGKTVTGTESLTAACSKCLKEMAQKGIPAFVDKAGREWSPEAYVNVCVRSTVGNTAHTALFERMKDYGTRLIEVDSHFGARPKCAKDQGKIYDLDNGSGYVEDLHGNKIRYYPFSSTSYGQPDGLFGINCRHHGYPFTAGISTQTYFPYDEEENAAQYRKIQKQRELERRVRASKRECAMLKDGDPREFQKSAVKLKRHSRELKDYCERAGLTYQNERTSVLGYGRSEAGRVTAAYRRALKQEEEKFRQITLDNLKNRDILESKIQSGELPLAIRPGQQNKHILGTNERKTAEGKSYLTIGIDEAQEIVSTKHGTGIIEITNSGRQIKEIVSLEKAIGISINPLTKAETPTTFVKIHYSKKGTHIVPIYPKK
ncbi:MAG: polymorphic toxin type 50 domain-containing protein [Bacteroides sp.]|nr:polymorphic toxin type 50 domain-containing protein [Eubacterium sp.]MCM1419635.1 polymorphic toxin type 50 domain-containing protein [Roseburia sp.]MCM1462973.1 polymorphic toxin type 50 domain-containing protein [Bacteroides sp.]